jgi:hypothetical protein
LCAIGQHGESLASKIVKAILHAPSTNNQQPKPQLNQQQGSVNRQPTTKPKEGTNHHNRVPREAEAKEKKE